MAEEFCLTEECKNICTLSGVNPFLFMPKKISSKKIGLEVRCAKKEGIKIKPGSYVEIPTGILAKNIGEKVLQAASSSELLMKKNFRVVGVDTNNNDEVCIYGMFHPDAKKLLDIHSSLEFNFGDVVGYIHLI